MNFAGGSYSTPSGSSADPVADGLLTITRASQGYAQNNAGAWTLFAANTLRRTDKGILIERKSTNVLNSQNSGAVASGAIGDTLVANLGTLPNQWSVVNFPSGLFYQVLAIDADSETNLPRLRLRVSGTAGADNQPSIRFCPSGASNSGAPAFATNDIIIGSCYARMYAGTHPGNMWFRTTFLNGSTTANVLYGTEFVTGISGNDNSGEGYVYVPPPASTPSAVQRYETPPANCYATIDNGRFQLEFNVRSGVFYDFTIDLMGVQLEKVPSMNHRATSPVFSASTATTWTAAVTAATSNTVASTTNIQIGQVVWGTGIVYGTMVTNIVGNTITFSKAITVSNGGTVRFIGGVREQDVPNGAGALLTMAQASTAGIKATTGPFGYKESFVTSFARGVPAVPGVVLPIVGINGSTALLQRETDGSISTAYGAAARTFKTFLGNYTTAARECGVSWNGTNLSLHSAAGGDYMTKASTATSITALNIGHKGGTDSLDGYLQSLVVTSAYGPNTQVGNIAADVIVYGAKPGGIVAAYRAKAEGRSVAIIGDWREHTVGGMQAGGLGFTDYVDAAKTYVTSGITGSGTNSMTLTDATGITKGVRITHGSIPNGTYVTNVSGNVITMSANTTASIASGSNVVFDVITVGSASAVLRCTSVGTTPVGATQIVLSHTDNMVVGANISQHLAETSIRYGTRITAIDTGTNTVTISQPLIAALSSGTLLKTWAPGGYGGLPRWVHTRVNKKARKADDELYGEPRHFRMVFEDMLTEMGISVYYSGGVDSVAKSGAKITSFTTASRTVSNAVCSAKTVTPKVVIGSDYEGDFLPLASISNTYGREANALYGENHNGFDSTTGPSNNGGGIHQPTLPDAGTAFNVDPWVTPGSPASGPLVGIHVSQVLATTGSGSGTTVGEYAYITADNQVYRWNGSAWALPTVGMADDYVQAYNFRLTLTKTAAMQQAIFSGTTGSLVTNGATTSSNVLNFADTSALAIGYGVFGTDIPYGTTITAKTSTTATISATVTVANGATISYLNPADFGFSAARAELFIRTIKAFSDAATAASRTFTAGMVSSATAGQWGLADFIQGKSGLSGLTGLFDCNNVGGIGLDYNGGNRGYLTASYMSRETIWRDHINHILMLWWVLQFYIDPTSRVPAALITEARLWGFHVWHYNDYIATEHPYFNPQLYVREGRRMLNPEFPSGDPAMTEEDICYADGVAPRDARTVGLMSYALDHHQMVRLPVYNGGNYTYWNEGGVVVFAGQSNGALGTVFGTNKRGPIAMAAIVPAETECSNYITTFHGAMSSVVFGGFRMEPSSMSMGESAGLLAAMAVESDIPVQDVTYGDDVTAGTFRYRLLNSTPAPTKPIVPLVN